MAGALCVGGVDEAVEVPEEEFVPELGNDGDVAFEPGGALEAFVSAGVDAELVAPIGSAEKVVFADGRALAANPVPLLQPQPQRTRAIIEMQNRNKCDFAGLKFVESDAA